MDIIMMLTYAALVIVVFKIFKVPVTKWTVTTAAFGGALLMGWIYISMAYFHPYSPFGKEYFETTPIAINVKGKVSEVYVDDTRALKKGDKIFKINDKPFLSVVKTLDAELKLANKRLNEQKDLYKRKAGTLYELEAREAKVAVLQSKLIKANFDLNNTLVTAPADGHLIQNRITVGTMAGAFKVSSLITFVPDKRTYFVAAFRSNGISNIKVGAKAEVYFVAKPGKVFKAKVTKVWNEIAEGQLQPFSKMKSVTQHLERGRIPVELEILEDISAYEIPKGSTFGATVYSTHLVFLGELRSIFFHMFSWQNIINFEDI